MMCQSGGQREERLRCVGGWLGGGREMESERKKGGGGTGRR